MALAILVWLLFLLVRMIQALMSFVANLLTLVCVIKYKFLHSPATILVACLAFSDFLHSVVTLVLIPVRNIYNYSIVPIVLCNSLLSLEAFTVYAQFLCLCLLAIERWNSLQSQLGRRVTWNMKKVIILTTTGLMVIATYIIALAIHSYIHTTADRPCTIIHYFPTYYPYIGFLLFLITLSVIVIFYGAIAYKLRRAKQQIAVAPLGSTALQQQQVLTQRQKTDIKITRMMAMVAGAFFVLYFPFVITGITLNEKSPHWQLYLHYLMIIVYDVNFWINPIIYAWRSPSFRKALNKLLAPCRCRLAWNTSTVTPNTWNQNHIQTVSNRVQQTKLTPRPPTISDHEVSHIEH